MELKIIISEKKVDEDINLKIANKIIGRIVKKGKIFNNEVIRILDQYPNNSYEKY